MPEIKAITVPSGGTYFFKDETARAGLVGAYVYKGSVATKTALPSSGQAVGHVYLVEDEEKKYTWNGSEWEVFGSGGGDSDPYATTEEIDALFDYELLTAEEASF